MSDVPEGWLRVANEVDEEPECPNCSYQVQGDDKVQSRHTSIMGGIVIGFEVACPRCGFWIDVHDGLEVEEGTA